MQTSEYPVVVLLSGQTLHVKGVLLYEAERVAEITNLRNQALQKMGGVSTGIGFIGSPDWALGGAAALGLLEGILSSAAKKQGVEFLQLAISKTLSLNSAAEFFHPSEIENIDLPHPAAWLAERTYALDLSAVSSLELTTALRKHRKTKEDLWEGHLNLQRRYVHHGDEFVTIQTDLGQIDVRWSQIVAYRPRQ